jgi:DNA invertase Pin-like site-specific DNA recombinase
LKSLDKSTVPAGPGIGRRAFSYLRISTAEQRLGHGIHRQLEASRAYALEHGLELQEGDVLTDEGVSAFKGANVVEGNLGRFLAAVRAGKVEPGSTLIIESLDRLSRQEVTKSLEPFLAIINAGITIVTLTDKRVYAPGKTEMVELMMSIMIMSRAHEESTTKSLRIGASWAEKRRTADTRKLTAQGPGWVRLSRDRKSFEVIESRAATVRRIFDYSAAGIGYYTITRRLNAEGVPTFGRSGGWHNSSVAKVLSNRAVLGEFQAHRVINGRRIPEGDPVQDYFPAIIDEALFYRAQSARSLRRMRGAGRRGPGYSNLFSGLLRCAYCGSRLRFENKGPGRGVTYLACDAFRRGLCDAGPWRYEHFERSFLRWVYEVDLGSVMSDEARSGRREELEQEVLVLQGKLTDVRDRMERTYELLSHGAASAFVAEKLRDVESERERLEAELREREVERDAIGHASRDAQDIHELVEKIRGSDDEDTYRLRAAVAGRLRSVVSSILVAPHGRAPAMESAIERLAREGGQPMIDGIRRTDEEGLRYFIVNMVDGKLFACCPNADDPNEHGEWLLREISGERLDALGWILSLSGDVVPGRRGRRRS